MYEVSINGVKVAENMNEFDALIFAERYMQEHKGEDLTVNIRRQEGKC